MHTEFKKAKTSKEIRSLTAFDRKVFRGSDRFPAEYWKQIDVFWMLIDNVKVGCCGFERNVDFQGDLSEDGINPRMEGSLYVATTGILPKFQGLGLGQMLKCWEISYARHHRFHRIVTNTRERNVIMIELNKKFGFQVIRTTPRYYSSPMDSTVVMELRLTPAQSRVRAPARSAAHGNAKRRA